MIAVVLHSLRFRSRWLLPLAAILAMPSAPRGARAAAPEEAFLEAHCFDCHDGETRKGGLDLTALTFDLNEPASFAAWVKVHDRVRDGEMPPPKKKRPPGGGNRRTLLATLDASF
jgi:mono/diheme cytochrome c family protein